MKSNLKNTKKININTKKINTKKLIQQSGGENSDKKIFLEEKIKLKLELEKKIKENEDMIRKALIVKEDIIIKKVEPPLKLSIKKDSFLKKIKLELPSIKTLDLFLFFTKIIICVLILPLIKHNFDIKNAFNDMLRNLSESIFTLKFFKENYNEIILFLDKLGNLIRPYKYLKKLLEKKEERNIKTIKNALKKFINYFINFETLTKIKLIMYLYKKKEFLFYGNISENINDVISLTSSILTILEVILYPYENYLLYKYIPKLNIFSLYSVYLIETIATIKRIYNLKKKNKKNYMNINILNMIEKYGNITSVLLMFCSNSEFYNDDFL